MLTGGTIGLTDPAFVRSPQLLIGNAFTGGLILFPLWVGTGLLAPIALDTPFIAADLGTPSTSAAMPLTCGDASAPSRGSEPRSPS